MRVRTWRQHIRHESLDVFDDFRRDGRRRFAGPFVFQNTRERLLSVRQGKTVVTPHKYLSNAAEGPFLRYIDFALGLYPPCGHSAAAVCRWHPKTGYMRTVRASVGCPEASCATAPQDSSSSRSVHKHSDSWVSSFVSLLYIIVLFWEMAGKNLNVKKIFTIWSREGERL